MDSNALVTAGHALLGDLEAKGIKARAAMWVHNTDIDTWKLWIVPPKSFNDQREFYRKVAEVITEHKDSKFTNLDASDVEMVADTHPAIASLGKLMRIEGNSSMYLHSNKLNDFYLAEGIVLRLEL